MINIFKNEAKDIIKQYLFWTDFLAQGFSSLDELKQKLQTIKDKVVYQGEFGEFYLTKEEAKALGKEVEPMAIAKVLESETYPIFLIERLSRVTSYSKSDLKYIPRGSEVVWLYTSDILMHFVIKDWRYIYPKTYPKKSPYRYGYIVIYNKDGKQGIYDIDADRQKFACEYSEVKLFANLAEVTKDGKTYEIIDLDGDKIVQKNTQKVLDNIPDELKKRLNLSKIDMEEYIPFFDTPKTAQDLIKMGLWHAKVGVLQLPSGYSSIIDDNVGIIGWEYPVSGDIFDMSVELPVIFEKKDGNSVTLGIKHEDIILEDRTILNSIKLPKKQKEQKYQEIPNWLKIKKQEFDDVDISNNRVDDIISLSSEEFNEFVSLLGDDGINMFLLYLKTLDEIELAEFFVYLEDVEIDESKDVPSTKEQFISALENVKDDTIKARATLELPLFLEYAKHIHNQALKFKEFIKVKYYPYKEDDEAIQFEVYLYKTLYSEPMKFIPDYFNQVLSQFRDYYDEQNDEHQKIALHLARRFGLLVNSLHVIQKAQEEEYEGLEWFLDSFVDEIKKVDGNEIYYEDKLLFYMTDTFSSIILEDDKSYIDAMIEVVKELMRFYPFLSESFLYALRELMKSVALKEIDKDSANRFLEIFEDLPKLYDKLSYSKIMELKETINIVLANDKPQDNKVFDEEGVKSKMILLNYLLDMEDLGG